MPHALATGLLMFATLTGVAACRKGAESRQREAERATEKAEEKAREATLTSGTLDKREAASEEAREAEDDALRAQGEALVALRREQLEYRARIQKELDEIDRALLARAGEAQGATTMVRRREALAADLGALDRSTQQDWAPLKTRIDRDLTNRKTLGTGAPAASGEQDHQDHRDHREHREGRTSR